MSGRRSRRKEMAAARRLDAWISALLAGRIPRRRLDDPADRRAAAVAVRLAAARSGEARAPQGLRERLAALPSKDEHQPRISRRRFLTRAAALAGASAAGAALAALGVWRHLEGGPWVSVGAAASFPPGVARPVMAGKTFAFVIREGDSFRALSGSCTHQSCPLRFAAAAGRLECQCHGAAFDLQGQLIPDTYYQPLPQLASLPVRLHGGKVQIWTQV